MLKGDDWLTINLALSDSEGQLKVKHGLIYSGATGGMNGSFDEWAI
jgi:hypothetical protein